MSRRRGCGTGRGCQLDLELQRGSSLWPRVNGTSIRALSWLAWAAPLPWPTQPTADRCIESEEFFFSEASLARLALSLQRVLKGFEFEALFSTSRRDVIVTSFGRQFLAEPRPWALRGMAGDPVLTASHASAALLHFLVPDR
jgi:hypothetical protein